MIGGRATNGSPPHGRESARGEPNSDVRYPNDRAGEVEWNARVRAARVRRELTSAALSSESFSPFWPACSRRSARRCRTPVMG